MNELWILNQYDINIANFIGEKFQINIILASIIAQRISADHESWLYPKLSTSAPNAKLLPDIQKLAFLIRDSSSIGIFSDYDADGTISAIMWKEFLEYLGKKVVIYIPERATGYGPNLDGILYLKECNVDCILFLDCGTDCHEMLVNLSAAAVIDHHVVKNTEKLTDIFINPYRSDLNPNEMLPFLSLCTAGLSFLIIGWIAKKIQSGYDVNQLLDIAAVATISDVMQLVGFNRALVKRGLELINRGSRIGITKLVNKFNNRKITAQNIAFDVSPKINAAGRIKSAIHALDVLDVNKCADINLNVDIIVNLNLERQAAEAQIIQDAIVQAEKFCDSPVIVVFDPQWNLGIVGIVAARLKDKYNKPAFVLTQSGEWIKGSARSPNDINISQWIQYAINEKVIISGGGHKAAGGVTLRPDQLASFIEFTLQIPFSSPKVQRVDLLTSIKGLSSIESLDLIEPIGQGNPAPKFWIPKVRIHGYKIIKEIHASLTFIDEERYKLSIMAFRISQKIKEIILLKESVLVDVVVYYSDEKYILSDMRISN